MFCQELHFGTRPDPDINNNEKCPIQKLIIYVYSEPRGVTYQDRVDQTIAANTFKARVCHFKDLALLSTLFIHWL